MPPPTTRRRDDKQEVTRGHSVGQGDPGLAGGALKWWSSPLQAASGSPKPRRFQVLPGGLVDSAHVSAHGRDPRRHSGKGFEQTRPRERQEQPQPQEARAGVRALHSPPLSDAFESPVRGRPAGEVTRDSAPGFPLGLVTGRPVLGTEPMSGLPEGQQTPATADIGGDPVVRTSRVGAGSCPTSRGSGPHRRCGSRASVVS